MRKWGIAVVVVALLAGVALLAVRPWLAERERCDQVQTYLDEFGLTRTVGDGSREVAVLGDSYLTGDLLPDRDDRWVVAFADELDATVQANGLGYTGYVNGGACDGDAFPDRSGDLEPAPLAVVAGGLNDVDGGADEVSDAATAALDDLSESDAVLVVGPVDAPGREGEADVDRVLSAAADERGATYLSMLDLDPEFLDDGVHMTAEGHAAYAAAVVEAATPLLR